MKIQSFDYSINILRALLWQHNTAARLESVLQQKQDWYDGSQEGFWSDWYRDVFDLRTANDFGLSVWAIILNLPLTATTSGEPGENDIFGFADEDFNFNNGNFEPIISFPLTTEQRRLILRLRYFQLVTRGTIPELNAFLQYLFGPLGGAFVQDGLAMNIRYVFNFELPRDLEAIFTAFDILPRPAGVRVDFVSIPEAVGFGFGRFHLNFNNGNFNHDDA